VWLASGLRGHCVKKQCGLAGLCFGGRTAISSPKSVREMQRWDKTVTTNWIPLNWGELFLQTGPGQDLSDQDLSDQDLSEQGLSEQGLSEQGLSEQGLSGKDLTDQGLSEQGLSEQSLSGKDLTDQGLSEQGLSEQSLSGKDLTDQGLSEQSLMYTKKALECRLGCILTEHLAVF
jgi:hypothetical protein